MMNDKEKGTKGLPSNFDIPCSIIREISFVWRAVMVLFYVL